MKVKCQYMFTVCSGTGGSKALTKNIEEALCYTRYLQTKKTRPSLLLMNLPSLNAGLKNSMLMPHCAFLGIISTSVTTSFLFVKDLFAQIPYTANSENRIEQNPKGPGTCHWLAWSRCSKPLAKSTRQGRLRREVEGLPRAGPKKGADRL